MSTIQNTSSTGTHLMTIRNRFKTAVVALMAVTALGGSRAAAVDVVRDGKPVVSIVTPAQPSTVESYAAKELQYHVQASTGAKLPIVSEDQQVPAGPHIYLGAAKRRRRQMSIPPAFQVTDTS